MTSPHVPVTVIGLGPMGRAMIRRLLAGGHPVTVWNRTPSRADGVVADGAVLAPTPRSALEAAELVVLSLTDYAAMDAILDGAADALAGRTLVNLSSDTPDRTREAAAWAAAHGAAFLAGGMMTPAPTVGTDDAYAYYSGPRDVFDRHAEVLGELAAPRYIGADAGLAQLLYQAQLDVFLTALSALMHATALVGSAGVPARDFLPEALTTLADVPAMLTSDGGTPEGLGEQIDAGLHPGDLSTAAMMGATADHLVAASAAAGIDVGLPRAVQDHYRRAIAAGHGGDGWTRIVDGIRDPR